MLLPLKFPCCSLILSSLESQFHGIWSSTTWVHIGAQPLLAWRNDKEATQPLHASFSFSLQWKDNNTL